MWKSWFIICTLIMTLFSLPTVGQAHAYMSESSPAQESELEVAPSEIIVKFTEPIDTDVSQLILKKKTGETIEGELTGEEDNTLIFTPPDLEDGIYNVSWQVLALDSHVTEGSFRFSVAEELPDILPGETIAIGEAEMQPPSEREGVITFLRIMENIVFVCIASWFVFSHFLWKSVSLKIERLLYFLAFIFFIITGLSHVFWRAMQFGGESGQHQVMWQAAESIVTSSVVGWIAVLRPVFFLILLALTFIGKSAWARAFGMLVVLGSYTVTSHAGQFSEITGHYVHMLVAIIWIGGLIGFTLQSLRQVKSVETMVYFHERITIFSKVALLSVLFLTVSGLWLSSRYIDSFSDLSSSLYGEALLWKIGSFMIAILVAAFHRFVWLPNLKKLENRKEKQTQITALVWGLRLELLLVMVSLIFAGIISTTSPPVEMHHEHDEEQENHDY